ncbi:hypothetical protein D3C76_1527650 [compost metagenome]
MDSGQICECFREILGNLALRARKQDLLGVTVDKGFQALDLLTQHVQVGAWQRRRRVHFQELMNLAQQQCAVLSGGLELLGFLTLPNPRLDTLIDTVERQIQTRKHQLQGVLMLDETWSHILNGHGF